MGNCYGIQVLIAGRCKRWRDGVGAEMRRVGYTPTVVDSAVDALTVLVLGLPVDVLLTDRDFACPDSGSRLTIEARALRPNLSIITADEQPAEAVESAPQEGAHTRLAAIVREAVETRIAP